ncbi:MAG: M28 family peptidase [Muribaculaceae bacterium]|nr:M28 family peptidase [Muribaculaceae bacterium]
MKTYTLLALSLVAACFIACGSNSSKAVSENMNFLAESESVAPPDVMESSPLGDFDADSAYYYVEKQVEFGPRVPNTEAHRLTALWLAEQLKRHGAKVTVQNARLEAFDGTILNAKNIFGQINPDAKERILLLAHWDSRPWADKDPDPEKRILPVDGANDGASGVGVILEIARQLKLNPVSKGIDILFVDAEDWGTDGDDESWALGTKYFVENPPLKNYSPQVAILLDMVGGENATFCREYFSERSAPRVAESVWQTAGKLGYGKYFLNRLGTAVMDDHVQLIKAGIPAIDIIEYHPDDDLGFNSRWHTTADNMEGISTETLNAVGSTLLTYLRSL